MRSERRREPRPRGCLEGVSAGIRISAYERHLDPPIRVELGRPRNACAAPTSPSCAARISSPAPAGVGARHAVPLKGREPTTDQRTLLLLAQSSLRRQPSPAAPPPPRKRSPAQCWRLRNPSVVNRSAVNPLHGMSCPTQRAPAMHSIAPPSLRSGQSPPAVRARTLGSSAARGRRTCAASPSKPSCTASSASTSKPSWPRPAGAATATAAALRRARAARVFVLRGARARLRPPPLRRMQAGDAGCLLLLTKAQNVQNLVRYPWMLTPGLFIFATVMCCNFLGDHLRDRLEPRERIV